MSFDITYISYLLQHIVLLLSGQPQVPLLAGAKLGRLFVKLLLPLLDLPDLLLAEGLQRHDEVVVGSLQHSVPLILDGVNQAPELLEAAGYHELVISLVGPDTVEPEVDQVTSQAPLGLGQILGSVYQIFHFFNQFFDIMTCSL